MTKSRFTRLAYLKGHGVITLCQHGLVHVSWHNITIRLPADEFQRLVHLLRGGGALASPVPLYDGDLGVAIEGTGYRVTIGVVELRLSSEDFLGFMKLAQQAAERMDQVLASNDWQEQEPPVSLTQLEELPPHRFSLN